MRGVGVKPPGPHCIPGIGSVGGAPLFPGPGTPGICPTLPIVGFVGIGFGENNVLFNNGGV